MNNSINQFLSSLYVTTQLQSETVFYTRLNSLIEQSRSNAPTTLRRLLFIIGTINHGNAYVSTYGTNFDYVALETGTNQSPTAFTQAMIYDDECSCGLYQNCTSQATFIETNSSEIVPIKGLKIGCTPSEAFRTSTLECFYDPSCINLIQEYTNYTRISPIPLSTTINRFSINTTMAELINDLFVEQWATQINYSSYFEQCSPLLCSYTYIQQVNSLYTVTFILSLQGGLVIVLKWVCPRIVRIIAKMSQHRKKRMNIIQPVGTVKMAPIETVNTNIRNPAFNLELMPTIVTSQYAFFIFI